MSTDYFLREEVMGFLGRMSKAKKTNNIYIYISYANVAVKLEQVFFSF